MTMAIHPHQDASCLVDYQLSKRFQSLKLEPTSQIPKPLLREDQRRQIRNPVVRRFLLQCKKGSRAHVTGGRVVPLRRRTPVQVRRNTKYRHHGGVTDYGGPSPLGHFDGLGMEIC